MLGPRRSLLQVICTVRCVGGFFFNTVKCGVRSLTCRWAEGGSSPPRCGCLGTAGTEPACTPQTPACNLRRYCNRAEHKHDKQRHGGASGKIERIWLWKGEKKKSMQSKKPIETTAAPGLWLIKLYIKYFIPEAQMACIRADVRRRNHFNPRKIFHNPQTKSPLYWARNCQHMHLKRK